MQLRSIGVASAARVAGVLYGILGLIAGVLVACISLVSAGFLRGNNPDLPPWFGALFGVGSIVFFPLLYGAIGLVFGAVIAALYNGVAGMVGGVELVLDDSGPAVSGQAR